MRAADLLLAADYAAGLGALAVFLTLGASFLREEWARAPRSARAWAAAGLLAAFAAGALLSRGAGLRAGRHNEHAFALLATPVFPRVERRMFEERDFSPRLALSLYERVAGRSFGAVRALQAALWALACLFAFLALRRGGLEWPAAAAGAGLLFFNRHGLLLARSLAPDGAAVMFLLAGAYALARLDAETDARRRSADFYWFCAANLLTAMGKAEFMLAQWFGLAVVCWRGRGKALHRPWRLAAAGAAASLLPWLHAVCLEVVFEGQRRFPDSWSSPLAVAWGALGNLGYHLSQAGVLPREPLAAVLLGSAAAGAALLAAREPGSPARLWASYALPWLVFFGIIHVPLSLYPLSHSRHHVFVLIPAALLLGAAAQAALKALPGAAGRGLLAAALGFYALGQASALRAARDELRTSDREWRFLAESRRDWPSGCAAVYPFSDARQAVLAKYFPAAPSEPETGACLLLYRSPRHQTAAFLDRPRPPRELPPGARPWREAAFEHRPSTDWHGPWDWSRLEAQGPLPVVLGFYRVDAASWRRLRAELPADAPDGSLPPTPARWVPDEVMTAGLRDDFSLELCYKKALSEALAAGQAPAAALACYDRALAQARARPADGDEALLLASRAELLRAMGRLQEARADVEAGRRAAASSGRASVRGARSLEAVGRWLDADPR